MVQEKFYKATRDVVFKAIFLPKNNWNLTRRLIEDATDLEDIKIISVVSPELPKDNIYKKGKILDVVVKTKDILYNIELNVYDNPIFHRRNFGYLTAQYINDLNVGKDYNDMHNHIQINISVSNSGQIPDYDIYTLKGERHNILFVDNFAIYEFNLSKIPKTCYNKYKFIRMLDLPYEELESYCEGDKDMEQFKKELERVNQDSEIIQLMTAEEEEEKYLNTVKSLEYNAGLETGIEQGIEQNSKEIAKKFKESGIDIKMISENTGLSIEEIEKL